MSRRLSDGTVLKPPQIVGLSTYTKTYRSFSIFGEDARGKFFASVGATYTFTPTQYSQTQLFHIENDESDRTKVIYDLTNKTGSTPVKMDGRRVEFKLPDDPALVFGGTTLTATENGSFVDIWERIQ